MRVSRFHEEQIVRLLREQELKVVAVQVARGRIELPTRGFSVRCSTN